MGYFAETFKSSFAIKKENYDNAYRAMCELNRYDDMKRGRRMGLETPRPEGSKSVSNNPDKWYSWVDWNYDETCGDLTAILEMLGFDVDENDNGIVGLYYDNKMGQEHVFFNAIAPYVEPGSYIVWLGEDGDMWAWVFENGTMEVKDANICW